MASINNWLAFSLSPQELPPSQPHPDRLISGVDGASATDCFGLSIDSASEPPLAIPTLRPDLPFGILEAFNRTSNQNHGWNMKGLDSMLVGSSSSQTAHMEEDEPKLEDFLGSHSSSGEYVFSDYKEMGNVGNSHSSSIGLSMIKTWLRNQPPPVPAPTPDGKLVVGGPNAGQSSSQSLSLSMSMASQSSSALPTMPGGGAESSTSPEKSGGALDAQSGAIEAVTRKSIDTFGQRTSIYRGVTRHRWTGRYEAHLWDNSCRREGQSRKGRQVYLGGYDKEEKAARSYDLAALKYWGPTTTTNFPISNYEKELEEMKHMTRQEYVASLRRKSSGFSRGASIYRGVTRHHQHGRWQARIGRVAGNKDLYLGTFSTQEEAAEAYDIAAIKFRGLNAVTNFDMSRYDVKSILESSTLPIGGAAKRLKEAADLSDSNRQTAMHALSYHDTVGTGSAAYGWPTVAFPTPQPLSVQYPYPHQRGWCKQEQDAGVPSHTMQDVHQLHLGSGVNTHDFFQPSMPFNNNFLSLPESGGGCTAAGSMEQAAGSDSVGYQNGYVLPMSNGHGSNACFGVDQEGLMGAYAYLGNPQLPVGVVKAAAGHEQSGGFSGWGQAAVPSQVGVPLFSVWNDS